MASIANGDPWAAERSVRAVLERCGVDVGGVSVEAFVFVAGLITQYKRRPVTADDIKEMVRISSMQRTSRKVLDRAAGILRSEIDNGKWRTQPGFKEHVRRWEEAIAVLQMPRGPLDNPDEWLKITSHGIEPWDYMATSIACTLVHALLGQNVKPSFRRNKGVVKFIREALSFIGLTKLPSESTVANRLNKRLGRMLRRPRPRPHH
jgi:hypothetical protein